jgi:hypothetical protein
LTTALTDRWQVGHVDHTFLEMTRARVNGILSDRADQNDHDVLRSDPSFKLSCGRAITGRDLASQRTLSLETLDTQNKITCPEVHRDD